MTSRIAIVGGGPKGLYGLERLLAELNLTPSPRPPVEIHLLNRTPFFGPGDIYRPDQPKYLLMNFSNGHVDMWSRNTTPPVASPALNFSEWLETQNLPGLSSDPRNYTPRSVTGAYLADGFNAISNACPDGIILHAHVAEVTGLRTLANAFELQTSSNAVNQKVRDLSFHWILVCTGHPRHTPDQEGRAFQHFAKKKPNVHYVDFVYPVSEKLQSVRPATRVAIKGLGLTFVDTVLALTEGRGGTFVTGPQGRLRYVPCGREPAVLIPFSRSGLPMIPRGITYGLPACRLNFFNISKLPRDAPLDFDRQIWPLLRMDMLFAYYDVIFRNRSLTLQRNRDEHRLNDQIEQFHAAHPGAERFDPIDLFQPFAPPDTLHRHTLDFMRRAVAGAKLGERKSPLIAAAAVWRHATPLFAKIYRFGGLTPASHRSFLANHAGHFNRLAFGPPIVNMQKIIAIAEAGLLDFNFAQNPSVIPDAVSGRFALHHAEHPDITIACDVLIDARIPKSSLKKDASPFFRTLLETDILREFSNAGFAPGCVDIDPEGNAIGNNGIPNKQLTFYGTPTEGITWDNDTLSRSHNDFASAWAKRVAHSITQTQ